MEIVIELPRDVDKLCRTCMSVINPQGEKNLIYNKEDNTPTELCKMLKYVAGNKLLSEGLPSSLCDQCVKKLEQAYQFKHQCFTTYANFQCVLNENEMNSKDDDENLYLCSKCGETFDTQYHLSKHEVTHFKEKTLTDRFCEDEESDELSIQPSSEIFELINYRKNNEFPFENIYVKEENSQPAEDEILEDEEETEENKPIIKTCDICDKEYDDVLQLTLHFINHALLAESFTDPSIFDQYFFCVLCGETFEENTALQLHYDAECKSDDVRYTCSKCKNIDTDKEIELLKHESEIHQKDEFCWVDGNTKTKFYCPICIERFKTKQDLTIHSVRHILKQITCRVCKKTFCSQMALNSHLRSHPKYKHLCELCGKYLGSKHALKTHIMGVHSSDSNYTCTVCSKKFKTPSRLYIHNLIHKKDKKFECDICGYRTNNVGDFKIHMRRHTCERPYKCNFVNCNRQFKTSSHLNEHIQRHLQIKKFECDVCHILFGHKHTLKMHRMVHSGEKPFDCHQCDLKFRRKHHLKNHMRQHSKNRSNQE